jgi:hypothetical protein
MTNRQTELSLWTTPMQCCLLSYVTFQTVSLVTVRYHFASIYHDRLRKRSRKKNRCRPAQVWDTGSSEALEGIRSLCSVIVERSCVEKCVTAARRCRSRSFFALKNTRSINIRCVAPCHRSCRRGFCCSSCCMLRRRRRRRAACSEITTCRYNVCTAPRCVWLRDVAGQLTVWMLFYG